MASRLRGLAYATALVWISAYICRNWFYHPTAHMNSLYGYWAALAKWGAWSWPPAWWPFHDLGSPIEFLSAPLIPAMAHAIASITGVSHLLAVQAVSAIFYCAAPVALFLTAWSLTRAPGASFLAAIGYVLLSPAQILAPDGDFRWARIFEPHRFMLQAIWDETPRCASLTFLLVFLLLFARWLESRRARVFVLACIALSLAMLASPFAAISAALTLLALLTARREHAREWAYAAGAMLLAWALAARWLPPSVWTALAAASAAHEPWNWTVPRFAAAAGVAWTVVWSALERWIREWQARFAVLLLLAMCSAPVFAYWLHTTLLPQSHRFRLEMEAAVALAAAFGFRAFLARARASARIVAVAAIVAAASAQVVHHRRLAKDALYPVDAGRKVDRRVAERAAAAFPGRVVMLPGSMAHWANWFAPVLQFGGSEGTTAYSQAQQRALVDVYAAHDLRASVAVLEAYGAAAVVAPAGRFDGVLPALWTDEGLTAYQAPGRAPTVEWLGRNRARVTAIAEGGKPIRIPVSYHAGWRAAIDGRATEVRADSLGLIAIAPPRDGPATIELTYDGGPGLRTCAWLSVAAALACAVVLARGRVGK